MNPVSTKIQFFKPFQWEVNGEKHQFSKMDRRAAITILAISIIFAIPTMGTSFLLFCAITAKMKYERIQVLKKQMEVQGNGEEAKVPEIKEIDECFQLIHPNLLSQPQIMVHIGEHLSTPELLHLSRVSKHLHSGIKLSWQHKLKSLFPKANISDFSSLESFYEKYSPIQKLIKKKIIPDYLLSYEKVSQEGFFRIYTKKTLDFAQTLKQLSSMSFVSFQDIYSNDTIEKKDEIETLSQFLLVYLELLDHSVILSNKEKISLNIILAKAVYHNRIETVKLALKLGADPDTKFKSEPLIFHSMYNNSKEVTELLLKSGANPNLKGLFDESPVMSAVKQKKIKMLHLLVKYHADLNIPTASWFKTSYPLNYAVIGNWSEGINVLLDNGARIDAQGRKGDTALSTAVYYRKFEAAELLIERGADITIPSGHGQTPIAQAVIYGDAKMVKLLLDAGSDPTQTFSHRQGPRTLLRHAQIQKAHDRHYDEIIALLEDSIKRRASP
ncbi:MAG: hypothetical protein Tsb0021_01070 [Chlamydiales bacterium]